MNGSRSSSLLALGLLALALSGFGLGCGTTTNAQFCSEDVLCPTGLECVDSACLPIDGPDASSSCPPATHQCIPNVPADWSGPMLGAELGNGEAFAACAAAAGSFVGGGVIEAGGQCECSCTTADTIACTTAKMEAVGGGSAGCSIANCNGGCLSQELSPGTCTAIDVGMLDENNVRMRAGTITGGSCIGGTATLPNAELLEPRAMCPAATDDGDCGASAVCAALAPQGFSQASCIYQVGTHACPENSDYMERTVVFESLADKRSCDACECDLPAAGSSCGGETVSCNINGVAQNTTCVTTSTWNVGATAWAYEPDPADVDCLPSEANPAVLGEVTGVGPTTICCTPTE